MATRDFSKYFLYRWRYVIGYGLIGLFLAGLLVFAGFYLPGGLSEAEMRSVVRAANLSLSDPASLAITNLPYYAFQALIFSVFGVSMFTIKLPSLILALLSAIGLILLLRRWFKPNIAVLASLIAISTGQFLFIAQSGTPSVLYIFWPIALLLLGTQITRWKKHRFLWKILFAITAGLSLYTPLSIYPLLAIVLAIALHPHLRSIIRRLSKVRLSIVTIIFGAIVAPLVWFCFANPQLAATLIGIPTNWPPDLGENAVSVLQQYFLYWKPSASELMTPVFGLGSALLIILGLYRLILTRETTRSYLIIFWIVCLIPVLLLNPLFTSVTFVPSVLMLAAGLTSLITYWYRLFPLNPYARVTGLVPIVLLVGVLLVTGIIRYGYGYHYSPTVAPLFSTDLALLPANSTVVVSDDEYDFYSSVEKYNKDLTVKDTLSSPQAVVSRAAWQNTEGYSVTRIITNPRSDSADRWYVVTRQ